MGSGSSQAAPAPDPNIGVAARMNAQIGRDWLDFAKEAYGTAQVRQEGIDELAKKVANQQLTTAEEQADWARQAHERYVNKFEPLQDQYIQEANDYASPARQDAAAAAARADVERNATIELSARKRQDRAYGVRPDAGRYRGIDRAYGLGTAVNAAGAETLARRAVEDKGLALKANAINVGNGLPAQAATSTGLGLTAGTGAAGVTNAANGQFLASTGIMDRGFGGAMTGYANQANILQNQYNSQLNAWSAQQAQKANQNAGIFSGIGNLLGLGLSAGMMAPEAGSLFALMSSKKLKTDKRKSEGNLKAVESMPVERWRYKDGVADGGAAEHTGPYAEDFKKATGHGDGRSIPIVDAIGVTMGAVQELSGKVASLQRQVGIGRRNTQPMKKAA